MRSKKDDLDAPDSAASELAPESNFTPPAAEPPAQPPQFAAMEKPRTAKRVTIEHGPFRKHQTADVTDQTASDLLKLCALPADGTQVLFSRDGKSFDLAEPVYDRVSNGEVIRVFKHPAAGPEVVPGPVISGS